MVVHLKPVNGIVVENEEEDHVWEEQLADDGLSDGGPLVLEDCLYEHSVKHADVIRLTQ